MRFVKQALLVTTSSLVCAAAASAADLPMKAAPYAAPTAYSWNGLYIGGSAAGGLHERSADPFDVYSFEGYADESHLLSKSKMVWGVGAQIGYNWQIRRAVFGIEADYTYLQGKSNFHIQDWVDNGDGRGADFSSSVKGLITVRGRFGFDVMDGLLVYGTAGVGWLKTENNFVVNAVSGTPKGGNFSNSKWTTSFVAGGGVEYMLTRNWSVRGEVLWVQPQSVEGTAQDTHYYNTPMNVKYDSTLTLGKIGVNYHF